MTLKTSRQRRTMRKAIRMLLAGQSDLTVFRWLAVWSNPQPEWSTREFRIFANRNKRAHDLRIAIVKARHNRRYIP